MKPDSGLGSKGSTLFFPIDGNVYPKGYYTVNISIGNPSKSYVLDVDTGSDLTWVQCVTAPFFTQPPSTPYYEPTPKVVVLCHEPACIDLGDLGDYVCEPPLYDQPCEYKVAYADGGSSDGPLVRDSFSLTFRNGTAIAPNLTFGCGYLQKAKVSNHQPVTEGILGLGKGKSGILKQLSKSGLIRDAVSHCLSSQGGGYLFFGEIPLLGIAWKQISNFAEQYSLGSANILLGGEATDIRGLEIIFDSGSTYTYLNSKAYGALLDLVTKNLNGLKDAVEDTALPVCWKGEAPIGSIDEVVSHFLPLAFNFTDDNIQFQMDPKSYLIKSEQGNVCFGILNGTEIGLEDMNLIGDISMQDKLVIYDNENGMVGWAAVETCNLKF
ncbi:aspartic proteinase asp1 [Phtheirospermum japonicum]|uniref:Aspartic proteinase asp1 n=1 Tax=Phtheirospermum japonicum TaxID=374723 RepID=A0A830BSN5_9LAMI|nr:aspartic proteinase asp1 [Phtheirospermum japonicum]